MRKPILCLDFDGVIHDYRNGWGDGSIYGDVTDGFWDWALEAQRYFRLVVFTSRVDGVREWMLGHGWPSGLEIDFAERKPQAFVTIDDRALTFGGDWGSLPPADLLNFKPWNAR